MVVVDDRGVLATGCPAVPLLGRMTWTAFLAIGGRSSAGSKAQTELAVKDEVAFWQRADVER
jgi:hypothetical protein